MGARKIIIDTDPGQDDAVALLLAFASPEELEVLAVTTVAGNVPLELTTRNALTVCELAGRSDVPVHAGCDGPMTGTLKTAEAVHGQTGLDGVELPPPSTAPAPGHAVDILIETLRREPAGTVTLCTLGALTNVATAFARAPDIVERVAEIVVMGGAYFEVGNWSPAAEFNILVDPEAAQIVFRAGRPLTILPLDVTHKALITPDRLAAFGRIDSNVGRAVHGWLGFYERFDMAKYGWEGGPLHDPCVIAYLLKPDLFSGRFINVEVETQSELTRGMTVADWWNVTDRHANATFIGDVDADGFYALLTDRLARL